MDGNSCRLSVLAWQAPAMTRDRQVCCFGDGAGKRRFGGHIMAGSITFRAPPASMVGWPTGWLAWNEAPVVWHVARLAYSVPGGMATILPETAGDAG